MGGGAPEFAGGVIHNSGAAGAPRIYPVRPATYGSARRARGAPGGTNIPLMLHAFLLCTSGPRRTNNYISCISAILSGAIGARQNSNRTRQNCRNRYSSCISAIQIKEKLTKPGNCPTNHYISCNSAILSGSIGTRQNSNRTRQNCRNRYNPCIPGIPGIEE